MSEPKRYQPGDNRAPMTRAAALRNARGIDVVVVANRRCPHCGAIGAHIVYKSGQAICLTCIQDGCSPCMGALHERRRWLP